MRSRLVKLTLVVLAVAFAVAMGTRAWQERSERRELQALRAELSDARLAADRCRVEIARDEAAFQEFDRGLDSLRAEVRAFEALDERGVPGDQYDDYMESFDRYNAAIGPWEDRADSLRLRWEACRDAVESHNVLADSLRRRLEAVDGTATEGAPIP